MSTPRRTAFAAAILPMLVAMLVCGWTFVGLSYPGWFTDSLDYLWFADFFTESFRGAVSDQAASTFRTTRYPPLLPLLLAASGAGSAGPMPANALMFVLCVACVVLTSLWALHRSGSFSGAVLAGLCLALSPGWFLLLQTAPISEPLMLSMVLFALLLAEREKLGNGRALALALVAGAVPLARTIGLAFALPVAMHLLAQRQFGRRRFAYAALAVLPAVAWSALRATLPHAEQYTDSLDLDTIRKAVGPIDQWLLMQPVRMVEGAAQLFSTEPGAVALGVAAALTALALVAVVADWRRLEAQFLVLYAGIVFVWPFPAEMQRFMAVLLPIVLVLAARGSVILATAARVPSMRAARLALPLVAAVTLAVATPTMQRFATFALLPTDQELQPFKRNIGFFLAPDVDSARNALEFSARMIGALRALPDYVPQGQCVYSVSPPMVRQYGHVAAVAVPRGLRTADEAIRRLTVCRYLLAISATTAQFGEDPHYPAALLREHARPLFESRMMVRGVARPAVTLLQIGQPGALQ